MALSDYERLVAIIRKIREYHGMSREELAEKTGVSLNDITGFEENAYDILAEDLMKICEAFGIDIFGCKFKDE